MNVRAQISMMFHLDKCIGCHTCSIACKNIWMDRQGVIETVTALITSSIIVRLILILIVGKDILL